MHVERAMQSFGEILEGDPEYLPAVLGMATGFMIEKNQVLHAPTSFFDCDATFEPLELWNALTAQGPQSSEAGGQDGDESA